MIGDNNFASDDRDYGASLFLATFIKIPAGSFMMGSPENELGRKNNENGRDGKQVKVTISKSFEMMSTEVTQMQWFSVMGTNPSRFTKNDCWDYNEELGLCPNNPVERVSWEEVQLFIKRLNSVDGDSKKCEGTPRDHTGCYRLPTDAEWEYAARGKTNTAYFFGHDTLALEHYGWFNENSGRQTQGVGLKRKNPYGLYDMYGNVWEWVQDTYHKSLQGGTDPLYAIPGLYHVVRGGSWYNSARNLRSANRYFGGWLYGIDNLGFRLVRTL